MLFVETRTKLFGGFKRRTELKDDYRRNVGDKSDQKYKKTKEKREREWVSFTCVCVGVVRGSRWCGIRCIFVAAARRKRRSHTHTTWRGSMEFERRNYRLPRRSESVDVIINNQIQYIGCALLYISPKKIFSSIVSEKKSQRPHLSTSY